MKMHEAHPVAVDALSDGKVRLLYIHRDIGDVEASVKRGWLGPPSGALRDERYHFRAGRRRDVAGVGFEGHACDVCFAQVLHGAVHGAGVNDDQLVRRRRERLDAEQTRA